MTPLGEAARQGNHAIARLLIIHGAGITTRMQAGRTPLHFAASSGKRQAVEVFLHSRRSNWNIGDVRGCSPMFLAAAHGHASVVEILWLHGANATVANHGDQTPLHIAAQNGHKTVVKLLLRLSDVDVLLEDSRGWTPADLAAKGGHVGLVKLICSKQGPTIGCLTAATRKRLLQFLTGSRVLRRAKGILVCK
ncbi:Serine/threonine-protein phosphatase 6 regulatory ankyrin repeat subunit C [Metarhizium anisopliae]